MTTNLPPVEDARAESNLDARRIQFARELADPDWSLSVPEPAKAVIRDLLAEVERLAASRAVPSDHTATTEPDLAEATGYRDTATGRLVDDHTATTTEGDPYLVERHIAHVNAAVADYRNVYPEPHALSPNLALAARGARLLAAARPDTTTEWGVQRDDPNDPDRYEDEDTARDVAKARGRVPVRREVTAWIEADQ